jgi:preprotein translocase subunit SecA
VASEDDMRKLEAQRRKEQEGREYQHAQSANLAQEQGEESAAAPQPVQRLGPKVGRNDPCPCGSEKKYKQCHGKIN